MAVAATALRSPPVIYMKDGDRTRLSSDLRCSSLCLSMRLRVCVCVLAGAAIHLI